MNSPPKSLMRVTMGLFSGEIVMAIGWERHSTLLASIGIGVTVVSLMLTLGVGVTIRKRCP